MAPATHRQGWPWLRVLPLLAGALAFAPGLEGGFVLDDELAIVGNPAANGTGPWSSLLTTTFWGRPLDQPPLSYRPLASLSFRLDAALFGLSPLAFHVHSLLLYLAILALGQGVALIWLEPRAACLALALFAVMPLHAENVASLVGRADTLALLLSLAALWSLAPMLRGDEARQRGGPGHAGRTASVVLRTMAACLLYGLALLCKESAILLPVVVFFLLPAGLRTVGRDAGAWVRGQAPALSMGLVALAYMALRVSLIPDTFAGQDAQDNVASAAPAWLRAAVGMGLIPEYLRLAILPVDLCTGRKYAEVSLPSGAGWILPWTGAALLLLMAWLSARSMRRGHPPFLLCALASWVVFSSLIFPVPEVMADRFMLAPSFFLALAAGCPLARWSAGSPRWRLGLLAGAVALQGAVAGFYSLQWRSTLSVLSHGVVACPSSVHNHYRLAQVLSGKGRAADAVWHYAVAARGRQEYPHRWRHPCPEAELTLPLDQRLRRMHALLEVAQDEVSWRLGLAAFLRRRGLHAEEQVVLEGTPRER